MQSNDERISAAQIRVIGKSRLNCFKQKTLGFLLQYVLLSNKKTLNMSIDIAKLLIFSILRY